MREISRIIVAGMLAFSALPARGAGRGSGVHSDGSGAQPAHSTSVSTSASHVSTHGGKPPKTPGVGASAPAPVTAPKAGRESVETVSAGFADSVPDDLPVSDSVPVTNAFSEPFSRSFQPLIPSYTETEIRNSPNISRGPLRAGTESSTTTSAVSTGTSLWGQIDAVTSHMQEVLNNQPSYGAAVARLATAEQKVAALRAGGQEVSDQIRAAEQEATEARQKIIQMRISALEADPDFRAALTRQEPGAVVSGESQ